MNPVRTHGKAIWLLIGLIALAGLCAVCGVASAATFTDTVGESDVICYDINVETVIDPLEVEVSWESDSNDIDIYLLDSQGNDVDYSDGTTNTEYINSDISTPGLYALVVMPYDVTGLTTFTGDCNYPITKTTVKFEKSIEQGENINYEITVTKPNKPLLIRVEWDQSIDDLNFKVYDPSGDLMTPDTDNSFDQDKSILGWYDLQESGKYVLKINGGVVESANKVLFTATSSYPIKVKGSGGDGDDDGSGLGSMMLPLLILVIVIILAVVIIAVYMRRKPKAAVAPAVAAPVAPASPTAPAAPYYPPPAAPTAPVAPYYTPAAPTAPAAPATPYAPAAPVASYTLAPQAVAVAPYPQVTQAPPPPPRPAAPPAAPAAPMTYAAPAAPAALVTCRNCGAQLKPMAKFCPNCGAHL